jgi:hypothetical protein
MATRITFKTSIFFCLIFAFTITAKKKPRPLVKEETISLNDISFILFACLMSMKFDVAGCIFPEPYHIAKIIITNLILLVVKYKLLCLPTIYLKLNILEVM